VSSKSPGAPLGATSERRWLADAVMVLVVTIWGLNNVIMKAALQGWVSPQAFNSIRFPMATLATLILMLVVEKDWRMPWPLFGKVALLGLLGNAVNQILFANGLSLSSASNAGIIAALLPILAALIGAATGLDRSSPRIWVGAGISFCGIILVTVLGGHGFTGLRTGDLMLLGATFTWTGYTVFAAPLARQATPLKVVAYAMLVGSVGVFLAGLPDLLRQDFTQVSRASWGGMLFAGLLSNTAAFGMYVWVIQSMGSIRASMFNNLSPIITALAAWLMLGERWVGAQWLGAALVIVGVLLARWDVLVGGLRKGG